MEHIYGWRSTTVERIRPPDEPAGEGPQQARARHTERRKRPPRRGPKPPRDQPRASSG